MALNPMKVQRQEKSRMRLPYTHKHAQKVQRGRRQIRVTGHQPRKPRNASRHPKLETREVFQSLQRLHSAAFRPMKL